MKITKDTKIEDIIDTDHDCVITIVSDHSPKVTAIEYRKKEKKEIKSFYLYVRHYLEKEFCMGYINTATYDDIMVNLYTNCFSQVPFELKIGLLKFICNENHMELTKVIRNYENRADFSKQIRDICPKEFLDSIFEQNPKEHKIRDEQETLNRLAELNGLKDMGNNVWSKQSAADNGIVNYRLTCLGFERIK